ncbi:hypothetical protein evm_007361 [Chilo suppressalis]|nr:hypothetical protein evm_007361 [Chilo suppressalis]
MNALVASLGTRADGFGSDPFAPSGAADPFAGDAFAPADNKNKANDEAWEADPFAVLHAPARAPSPGCGPAAPAAPAAPVAPAAPASAATPRLPPKQPPPRPAPPRPTPPHKARAASAMDFTEDPFKDYRYEDPFNIEDPFADAPDAARQPRPSSAAAFNSDSSFLPPPAFAAPPSASDRPARSRGGRVSAPPLTTDPFAAPFSTRPADSDAWAAWPDDNWVADDNWAQPTPPRPAKDRSIKADNWPNKSATWARTTDERSKDDWADWGAARDENLNETWPTSTLPAKKDRSPKPVKYAKSLVHTIGGIGRMKQAKNKGKGSEALPSEEQQWAWAAADSRRLQAEAAARRRQEDAELQLALAISRQEH